MTRRPWLGLAALWLALGVVMAVWVGIDRRPPEWDHANHLGRALHCRDIVAGPGHALREVLDISAFYPPLAICAAGLAYRALPVTALTAQAVVWAFLGLALASVFLLGRRLWDAGTGLLAALLLGTAPFVVFSLTNFQLDLPLAGMVALSLYALARSEGFARLGWSSACGALFGLGMLTKPTFAVYLLPPLAWAIGAALVGREVGHLGRIALALAVATAIALPWYGPRLLTLPMQIADRSFKFAAAEGHASALSAAGLGFYPRVLVPQLGALAAVLLVCGAVALWRRPPGRWLVWAGVVGPFALIALTQNKNLRYSLPILPAAALVAAAGVRALPAAWRRGAVAACVALGALQVSIAAFALPPAPHSTLFGLRVVFSHAPSGADWQHDRIMADLGRESGGRPATVSVVPNYNFLSTSTVRYEAEKRGMPLTVVRAWDRWPFGVDFAIVKTGSQGPRFTAARPERIMQAFAEDPYLAAAYPVVAEYPLPDGSRAALRARRPPPLDAVAPEAIAERLTRDPARLLAPWLREPTGLVARLDDATDALRAGRVRRLVLEAGTGLVGEVARTDRALLRVRDVRVVIEDLVFDARRLVETGALAPLDAGAIRIERLTVLEPDLRALLRGQPSGRGVSVTFGDGAADVRITRLGPLIAARVHPRPPTDHRPLALAVEDVRLGPVRVPDALVDWITRHLDPTGRLTRLPVAVSIAPVRIRPGKLEIGPTTTGSMPEAASEGTEPAARGARHDTARGGA